MTEETELQRDTRAIADYLIGTAQSIQHAILFLELSDKYDNETDLDTDLFDSLVFECARCEWWCGEDEMAERDGELICTDCIDAD